VLARRDPGEVPWPPGRGHQRRDCDARAQPLAPASVTSTKGRGEQRHDSATERRVLKCHRIGATRGSPPHARTWLATRLERLVGNGCWRSLCLTGANWGNHEQMTAAGSTPTPGSSAERAQDPSGQADPGGPAFPRVVILDTLPVPYSDPARAISARPRRLPWLARSLIAGAAGSMVVEAVEAFVDTSRTDQRRRRGGRGASSCPTVTRLSQLVDLEIGSARTVQVAYGSAIGLLHGTLRRRSREPTPSLATGASLAGLTLALLPPLGRAPLSWRWRKLDLLYTAGTCAVHALTVGTVHAGARKLQTGYWTARLFG